MINDESNNKEKEPAAIQEVVDTLNVVLPSGPLPFLTKVVVLLTSAGGLSIIANILSDIIEPNRVNGFFYILRLFVGIAMICVGYGILKRKGWTVWLYGGITIIGLIVNPIIAILPLCVSFYLYTQKTYFDPHLPEKLWSKFKVFFNYYTKQ